MARDRSAKEEIVAAIRRAAGELGRAPSRGELRRITGLSHYMVLAEFKTLRDAVRAAGLKPNPKGEKISTDDLIQDWKRVGKKLGRRPSRAEYVREGKYSAGAFVARFGSWGNIEERVHRGGTETRRKSKTGSRELTRTTRIGQRPESSDHKGHEGTQSTTRDGDKAIAFRWGQQLSQIPGPLAGKRRVTEAVAQLVVNTLLGERSGDLVIGRSGDRKGKAAEQASANGHSQRMAVRRDRPVMGAPFDRSPLTNAPVNELGVVLLFGMVAADMGFQVESLQGKFPDCEAKREVSPGKWQRCRIEFEYESKNFHLHGHDPKGCDVIVCWRHNWKDCPAEIEVVELSKLFGQS